MSTQSINAEIIANDLKKYAFRRWKMLEKVLTINLLTYLRLINHQCQFKWEIKKKTLSVQCEQ